MKFQAVGAVKVGLRFVPDTTVPVGRLVFSQAERGGTMYFEYEADFVRSGIEISPLRLPLQSGVQKIDRRLPEHLPGVFADSLPDGWGRLLLDRAVRTDNVMPDTLTPLDRLAYVGTEGTGALVYEPDFSESDAPKGEDLDELARYAEEIISGSAETVLQTMLALNGSSAGARPKAFIGVNSALTQISYGGKALDEGFTPWLVKFPNVQDGKDAGAIEYVYALMAKKAGAEMSATHLFPSAVSPGFFLTERFDRQTGERLHMHSAAGLLHADFRIPSLDYKDLINLTFTLTQDRREVEKIFTLAVFNVLAHNRDDHAKNFSFLMNEKGAWRLSPGYDLTFSSGPGGEQSMTVCGEGKAPGKSHLLALAREAAIEDKTAKEIIARTESAVTEWSRLARQFGVYSDNIALIEKKHSEIRNN